MKRRNSVLKLLFMMTLTLVSALVIVACTPSNTDKADVASAKTALEVGFTAPDTKDSVTKNVTLPATGAKDVAITWQSSHPSVISTAGAVTRPDNDTSVTLTATLAKGDETDTKNFVVKVIAKEPGEDPDTEEDALEALVLTGDSLALEGLIYNTTSNIVIPTTSLGFTVNWVSTSSALTTAGVVTRPAYGDPTARVVLTASIGEFEREFIIDVLAIEDMPAEDVLAQAQIQLLLTAQTTAEPMNLPAKVTVEGDFEELYEVAVTWASDSEHMTNTGIVNRPLFGEPDATVNLTATLSFGGQTSEKEFDIVVLSYAEPFIEVANFAGLEQAYIDATPEQRAKGEGVYVRVSDVSLVMKDLDGLVFVDSEGAFMYAYTFGSSSYAYNNAEYGVLYDVIGAIDFFNGSFQLSNNINDRKLVEVVKREGDPIAFDFKDIGTISDFVPEAQFSPSMTNPVRYEALTITAKVVVTSTTDNYGVFLADTSYTGDGSDLRGTGGSAYENRAVIVYYKSNKDVLIPLNGLEVTLDVILFSLRNDRNIYTVLFGGTLEDVIVNVTDEQVVDLVSQSMEDSMPNLAGVATQLSLPTSYMGASLEWASSHPAIISTAGVMTLPATGQQEVTLTATITKGESTKVVEMDILVGAMDVADILAGDNGLVKVTGLITGYVANNTLALHDESGAISLFISGAVRDELIAAIGDVVTITGTRTAFNGLQQIGSITAVETSTDTIDTLTVDITDLDWDAQTLMPHQNKLVSITGAEVTAVSTDSNGNISATLKVGEKTINLRWDARVAITGVNVLEFMVVGDIVDIVDAPLGWNNNPQLGYYVASQIDLTFDTHMVTFMDGETTLGTLEVRAGQVVAAFPQASKAGFTFDGWFSDATFDTAWLEADLVNDDVTLYAKFSELTGSLVVDTYDFIGLANATSYVTEETSEVVNGLTFTRMNANISASGDYKGIVLGIRTGNSWNSPYLQIDEKIEGAFKVVFNVTNWSGDAGFNLSFADGIYIQTSTDGETWVNSANFKDTWNTDTYGVNNIEMLLEGDVFVRLFVQSAGTQEGTFQLRLIVGSVEIHKMENLEAPVDVTFDPNYGEETATVMTIESGETVTPVVLAERVGFNFLGWFLAEAETAFDFETPITEDMTFEARWEEQVVTLQTIAEIYADAETNDIVKFVGVITGFAPYTAAFSNYDDVFMEDETGIIRLYRAKMPEGIAIGDKYEVEGVLDIFRDGYQIKADGTTFTLIDKGNPVTQSVELTGNETLTAADQGKLYNFAGVIKSIGSGGREMIVTASNGDIRIYTPGSSYPLNAFLATGSVGQNVVITNAYLVWSDEARLTPLQESHVEFAEFTDAQKLVQAEAALVAAFDEKEFDMEAAVTLPEIGLHGVTVGWVLNPTDAVADGKWKVVTEDTPAILTATLTLGENTPVEVELLVTIKFVDENAPVEPVTVTAAYPNGDGTTNMSADNNAAAIGLDPELFTVTSLTGDQSNHVGLNNTGQIRVYANRSTANGATLQISISSGTIIGVEFEFGASTNNPTADLTFGEDEAIELNNDTLRNITMTYTDLNITTFSLHNTQFIASGGSNAQIYILSIKITYQA